MCEMLVLVPVLAVVEVPGMDSLAEGAQDLTDAVSESDSGLEISDDDYGSWVDDGD